MAAAGERGDAGMRKGLQWPGTAELERAGRQLEVGEQEGVRGQAGEPGPLGPRAPVGGRRESRGGEVGGDGGKGLH